MTDPKIPMTEIDPELFDEALESVERHKPHGEKPEAKEPEEAEEEILVEEAEGEGKKENKEKEKDEMYDRFVRLTADFDNFRKRVQKEKSDYIRYGCEGIVKELLPVLDNFERALAHSDEDTQEKGSFAEGVQMIYSQLLGVFEQFGVKSESALGQEFDPLIHEAMNQMPSEEYPAQTVMLEHRKAYFLHDRLIRPALVTVSTGSEKTGSEDKKSNTSEQDEIETKEAIDE